MSEDARLRRLAELREKAILDEREAEYTGYCKGLEKGKSEATKTIAKNMKDKEIAIEIIEEMTNLSKEEIEAL